MHVTVRTRRVSILGVAITLFAMMAIPLLLVALWTGGFFDGLMSRFIDDDGSAAAREKMFAMFDGLSFSDLLVGPDPSLVNSTRRMEGLEQGIENPIISTLLYHGLIITALMILAVSAFLRGLVRCCVPGIWLPMLSFVIQLNGSTTLATKGTTLTKFAVMMLCLYRPQLSWHSNYRLWRSAGGNRAVRTADAALTRPAADLLGITIRGGPGRSHGSTRRI
jgi:hypothetical protein